MLNTLPSSVIQYHAGEQIILSNPDVWYRILKGSLTLHIGEYQNGTPGRRSPGMTIHNEQYLFGWIPDEVCLVSVFQTDTEIQVIPVSEPDPNRNIQNIWAGWIRFIQNNLFDLQRKKYEHTNLISLKTGQEEIEPGQIISFSPEKDRFLLCRILSGRLIDVLSEKAFDSESSWFPVSEMTFLSAEIETSVILSPPHGEDISTLLFHTTCREWFVQYAEKMWKDFLCDEEKRFEGWAQQEAQLHESIYQKTIVYDEEFGTIGNIFSRILKHLGMDETVPAHTQIPENIVDSSNLYKSLIQLAEEYHVRIRRVRLTERWWKEDSGPLIVIDQNANLMAAIPDKPGTYSLYDGEGIVARNDQIGGMNLNQSAFMLYPALPDKKLTIFDIISYIYHSIWKQDILFLILFGLIAGLLATAIPVATGIIFSEAIPYQNHSAVNTVVFILFMSMIASAIFQLAREIAIIRMEGRIGTVLDGAIWDRLLKLPPSFFRHYVSGDLASRMDVVYEMRMILTGAAITVIISAIFSIFNVILMYYIYPDIAGIAVLLVMGIFFLSLFIGYLSIIKRKQLLLVQGKLSGITFQLLSGISKISVSGSQNRAYIWWENTYRQQIPLRFKIGTYNVYSLVLTVLWPGLLTITVFALAGIQLSVVTPVSGNGWFLAFYAAVGAFSAAFVSLGSTFISLWNIKPMWDWISPVLTTETEVKPGREHPGNLTGAVELHHISFSYSKDSPPVLKDLSITINPGEFVAIVGASGSGKSTLLRILLGFEKPDLGSVLYDQKSLSQLNVHEVRNQMGVVLQDGQLMAGSIFNNIAGTRILSLEEAWSAAESVGLDAEIREMPMQIHTFISEGSGNISGGQKQRILIARAIASKPRIIYLDEATSALDNVTQNTVMESLEKLKLTRVVIAHRLSTIQHADRIYVLDKGKVDDVGTYQELLDKGGLFSQLAQHQLV